MKCPRCGAGNPMPERTLDRCQRCGYLLTGEVAAPVVDLRSLRRKQGLKLILTLLLIVAWLGLFAWWRGWLWWSPPLSFTPSDQPAIVALIGVPSISYGSGGVDFDLMRESSFALNAVVLGAALYDDSYAALAPVDLLVAWGEAARADRSRYTVTLQARSLTVAARDPGFDARTVTAQSAIVRIVPAGVRMADRLVRIRAGDRLAISGELVSPRQNRGLVSPPSSAAAFLVYVSQLRVNGRLTTAD